MVQFTLQKKTMASLAILEDRQAEVLSGGYVYYSSFGANGNNSGNFIGNNSVGNSGNVQIGSTYTPLLVFI